MTTVSIVSLLASSDRQPLRYGPIEYFKVLRDCLRSSARADTF
jgi:hypothetical protein